MGRKTEYQVCRNCGTVYGRRDLSAGFMPGIVQAMLNTPTMCPRCGGDLVWRSRPRLRPAGVLVLFLGLLPFIGIAVLLYCFYRYFFG